MNKYQLYRRQHGMCISCGEKVIDGRSRCPACLRRIADHQRVYEERKKKDNPDAYYQAKRQYQKKWADKTREHVREYKRKWYAENYKSVEIDL